MEEEWRDIDGFVGYQVSNKGRVRSCRLHNVGRLKECDVCGDEWRIKETTSDDGNGYLKVTLRRGGKSYCRKIHKLVAEAFIPNPNPDELDTVDHISNDKKDNRTENLQWISRGDNIRKAYNDGLHNKRIDDSKVPILVQNMFTLEEKCFSSVKDAADYIGVDRTTISHELGKSDNGRIRDYFIWRN